MDDQVGLIISFTVMIGLNLLAAVLIWAEYAGNRAPYLRSVAIGQSFALVWHLVSVWIVFDSENLLAFNVSAAVVFVSALYFLGAALYQKTPPQRTLLAIALFFSTFTLTGTYISPEILNWYWLGIMGVLAATPIATIRCFPLRSKWLIAGLQTLNGLALSSGVILLGRNNPDLGGLLYLTSAILVPMLSIAYIIASVVMSRLEIAEKERQYRVFFEAVNEVFFITNDNGLITSTSPSIKQFGIMSEEFVNSNLSDYLFDPETYKQKLNISSHADEPFEYTGSFRSESGFIECEIVCTPIQVTGSDKKHFAGSIRNTHERSLLEQQFIDAERHKSLAVLAGGIAHDFNNILQGIVGHAEVLSLPKELPSNLKEKSLKAILNATTTAGNLCRQLLQYTGKESGGKQDLDLTKTLNDVVDMVNPAHLGNVSVDLLLPDNAATIHGDKSQIAQIFLNLVRNSIDAVGDTGEISISLKEISINQNSHQDLQLLGNIKAGNYFVVSVKDDGTGIPESVRSKIFEPFFSTKSSGHGLGLAAVKGILKTHRGEAIVDSIEGIGTEIKVFLPAIHRESQEETLDKIEQNGESKLILLVDDDDEIRIATSAILESAGNRVVMAEDGAKALDIIESNKEQFNLVITDIRMPKMDGVTLAREAQKHSPSLPVILTTGYSDVSEQLTSSESLRFQFIRKPYRTEELLQAINAAS